MKSKTFKPSVGITPELLQRNNGPRDYTITTNECYGFYSASRSNRNYENIFVLIPF